MMKRIILFCLVIAAFSRAGAQDFKIQAENSREGKLILEDFKGDLPVEGYSGTEIIITATEGRFEAPERAKGLKPVYSAGTDNTGIGLFMEKNGNKITLHCLVPITQEAGYRIKVPENFSLKITRGCAGSGETSISNMKNEIEFNGCHDLHLKNVTGPLVVSTISGNVNLTFSDINKDKPISIASVSGEVDITLPAKAAIDLEMGTVSGNMYSDFEFPANDKEMRRIGGSSINTKLNGGGTDLKIHSVSGNVYLRKG